MKWTSKLVGEFDECDSLVLWGCSGYRAGNFAHGAFGDGTVWRAARGPRPASEDDAGEHCSG